MPLAPFIEKGIDLVAAGGAGAVKFVLGNPVLSRLAAGALIYSGAQDIVKEATNKQSEKKGAYSYIKGGIKLVVGGILAVFNDPSWYTNVGGEQFVTSLNFEARKTLGRSITDQRDPHAAVFLTDLTVPYDKELKFDTQVINYWKTVRAMNSGAINYTTSALRAYLVNLKPIAAIYTCLVRLYGLLNAFNSLDAAIPYSILKGLGLTQTQYQYLVDNMADFRTGLYNRASKMSSSLPMMGDYLNRVSWMFSNVYMDDGSAKAVSMLFDLGKFTHAEFNTSTQKIEYKKVNFSYFPGGTTTLQNLFSIFDSEYENAILFGGVTNILAGDITKAFGFDAYCTVDVPGLDYICSFVYTEEVLTQIENIVSAHYDTIDIDTGFSYHTTNTVDISFELSKQTLTDMLSIVSGGSYSSALGKSVNGDYVGSTGVSPIIPMVVNSPTTAPSIAIQFSYTRLTNGTPFTMYYDTTISESGTGTLMDPKVYEIEPKLKLTFPEITSTSIPCITNSGEDIYRMRLISTTQRNVTSISLNNLFNLDFDIRNNFVISSNTASTTVESINDQLLHYWSNVDWMPKFFLPDINTGSSSAMTGTQLKVTAIFNVGVNEMFDEKVFATYPTSTKATYDAVCTESLYYISPRIRTINYEESPASGRGATQNKGGNNNSKKKKKNKNKGNGKGEGKKDGNK